MRILQESGIQGFQIVQSVNKWAPILKLSNFNPGLMLIL